MIEGLSLFITCYFRVFSFDQDPDQFLLAIRFLATRKTDTSAWAANPVQSKIIEVVPRRTGTSLKQNAFDKVEAYEVETTVYNTLNAIAMQSDPIETTKVTFPGASCVLKSKKIKLASKDTAENG